MAIIENPFQQGDRVTRLVPRKQELIEGRVYGTVVKESAAAFNNELRVVVRWDRVLRPSESIEQTFSVKALQAVDDILEEAS